MNTSASKSEVEIAICSLSGRTGILISETVFHTGLGIFVPVDTSAAS